MKAGRKKSVLTDKEAEIMNILWNNGPLFIREILEHYDEPRPHFNTVATTIRTMEGKGYVEHEVLGPAHRFRAVVDQDYFRQTTLAQVVRNFFGNSYKNAVSALVHDEKISVEELQEIIRMMEENESKSQ